MQAQELAHTRLDAFMQPQTNNSPYPVSFSNGVWKYTLVVYIMNMHANVTAHANTTASIWGPDHGGGPRNDARSWSTRKSVASVRRNMCPETSCPLRRRGVPVHAPSAGSRSEAGKSAGCVSGESRVRVTQYSAGTTTAAPEGRCNVHSPPVETMRRSSTEGPKNQEVKASHTEVASANWANRMRVRAAGEEVIKWKRNAAVIHAQSFFTK